MSLRHNPQWVYFYRVCEFLWRDEVISKIPTIAELDNASTDTASREDILLRASRIGWTFGDNFSANWDDDSRAERFLKRFIESWIPYCRSYAGTESLAAYMSYLLGMEIRIVQLWSNVNDEWNTKPVPKLFPTTTSQLPEDYLIKSDEEHPFHQEVDVVDLRSESDLNNNLPGWKNIVEDPVNGWYPTSHYDVYVDLDQVPKSDLQEKTSEEIIAGLFYELADITQVLRAIVYSYSFTEIVRIASGSSYVNRIGDYIEPTTQLSG